MSEESKNEISLYDFIQEILKNKIILIILIVISLFLSSLHIYFSEDRWRGSISLNMLTPKNYFFF